ncbi:MAG: sulfatase-like hydrolase/transferase [Spirochaetaceae bacterium]
MKNYINQKTGKGPYSIDGTKDKPNILFITMDMVPPEFYATGNTLNTPAHTQLAKDGITFKNVFSTSPLCGPSRASILTGRYSYITGNSERSHDGHKTDLRSEDIIWPEYLRSAGYHTRHVGKSHVGTEHFMRAFSENSSPWDRWSPPWYDEDAYIDSLQSQNLKRFTFKKEIRGNSWTGERDGNSYGGWLADQNGEPFPEEALYPTYLVNRAITTLETRGNNRPFYLQLDFFGPHQPFAIPGGYEKREEEIRSTIEIPRSWLDWEASGFTEDGLDPRVYELYRKNWGLRNRQDLIDYLVANQLQYEILDKQMGRLINYLKDNDLYNSTMIIFTADHGEMNGRKGCVDKGAYLNPQVLQVPFILKPTADKDIKRDISISEPCSLLDIFPTISQEIGLSINDRTDGVSLFDTLSGKPRPEDKPVMFDVWNHVVPNPCVGRIFKNNNRQYLYTYNCVSNTDELYDLAERGQINNLIRDEELEKVALKQMYKALLTDTRWDVYNCYFKLEYSDKLQLEIGDNQKFE